MFERMDSGSKRREQKCSREVEPWKELVRLTVGETLSALNNPTGIRYNAVQRHVYIYMYSTDTLGWCANVCICYKSGTDKKNAKSECVTRNIV